MDPPHTRRVSGKAPDTACPTCHSGRMRSTCSLYIDTGDLLASAATRVTGTSWRRGINPLYPQLVRSLIDAAEARSGLPVLRVHWYDSAKNGIPDAQQERIGELPRVKLRLGRFGVNGEQKGVDLRIGLDLVAHARNGVSEVFFLVSGDDDLTDAVPTIDGKPHGVSRHLVRAADELDIIDGAGVDAAVIKVEHQPVPEPVAPKPAPTPARLAAAAARTGAPTPLDVATLPPSPVPARPKTSVLAYSSSTGAPAQAHPGYADATDVDQDDLIDEIVTRVISSFRVGATTERILELKRAYPSIPPDIDRALLLDASDAMQRYDLDEGIRYLLRKRFWKKFDES